MARSGFIVHPTYRLRGGRAVVQLFGRLATARRSWSRTPASGPYFFVHPESTRLLADERDVEIEPSELVDLAGAPVVRVDRAGAARRAAAARQARGRGRRARARGRPALPVPLPRSTEGCARRSDRGRAGSGADPRLLRFRDPGARARRRHARAARRCRSTSRPRPTRAASCRSRCVGAGADEVHVVSAQPVAGRDRPRRRGALVRAFVDARARARPRRAHRLERGRLRLRVLDARARARSASRSSSAARRGRCARAGRVVHAPAPRRDPGPDRARRHRRSCATRIQLDDFWLETAARTLLGRGKRIAEVGPRRARPRSRACTARTRARSGRLQPRGRRLVLEILAKEGLLALAVERSLLSGMQLDRVGASIASFDLLYLPELRRRGRVAPSVDRERERPAACRAARCSSRIRACSGTSRCSTSRACTRA